MNAIIGDKVADLAKRMTTLSDDERVLATRMGAVVALTLEGVEREAMERYRRVHKTRKLGL